MNHLPSKLKVGLWFTVLAINVLIAGAVPRTALAGVTPHSVVQAVFDDGASAFLPTSAIQVRGVVINNPWDMLDYSNSAGSPQWQVFIQAVESGDFGGTALYMRKSTPWTGAIYTDAEWTAEMDRLNYPLGSAKPSLRRGDLVLVDALAPGLFFGGKFNINEKHSTSPLMDFSIKIEDRDIDLTPLASSIDLTFLKNDLDQFIFDPDRKLGNEHFQGSLVHLDNLSLVDPLNWKLNGPVTVRQGNRTMPMLLGLDPGLALIDPSNLGSFSVTAILDQEDPTADYTGGYRLWLTNAGDLSRAVPEPGTMTLAVIGGLLLVPLLRRKRRGIAR